MLAFAVLSYNYLVSFYFVVCRLWFEVFFQFRAVLLSFGILALIYLYYFYVVEEMGNFHLVLVRIVVDHDKLLSLKSVVVYFDFIKRSFEYLF